MRTLLLLFITCLMQLGDLKSAKETNKETGGFHGYPQHGNQLRAQSVHASPLTTHYVPTHGSKRTNTKGGHGGKSKGGRESALKKFIQLKRDIISRFSRLFRRPLGSIASAGYYRPYTNRYRSPPYISYGDPYFNPLPVKYSTRKATHYGDQRLRVTDPTYPPYGSPPSFKHSRYQSTDLPYYDADKAKAFNLNLNSLLRSGEQQREPDVSAGQNGADEMMTRQALNEDGDIMDFNEIDDYFLETDNTENEFESLYEPEELARLNDDVNKAIRYLMDDFEIEDDANQPENKPWPENKPSPATPEYPEVQLDSQKISD